MSYRFKEARLNAGLTTAELAKIIGVSQPAVTKWDTGASVPNAETLLKLADLYGVTTDYLLGRSGPHQVLPVDDRVIEYDSLPYYNGKPVWDETRGWGIVNSLKKHVIFMDGSTVCFAEALNLRAMPVAFSLGYSPATKPISYKDLKKYKTLWIRPISPDLFLRDEMTGWYQVHEFFVQNQYGTRFLFDTYGVKWLAFNMEF